MIFSDILFERKSVEQMYKSQMEGFDDESLKDFNPILLSCVYVREKKEENAEREFIASYLEGAKVLMKETYKMQGQNGIKKIFYNYSLVLPTIYLCRHCLELSLKRAIRFLGKDIKLTHGLEGQWDAFRQCLPEKMFSGKERSLLNCMGEFIKDINRLDDNGTRLRYPVQRDKSFSQEKFLWANTKAIVESTESFVKQMELLKKVS